MSCPEDERVILVGQAEDFGCDNSVRTSKYTLLTFFPIAIKEQFRRNGNIYFLCVGFLMAVGWYTDAFDSAISPWTTLGPLAVVVSISLLQEGAADLARHQSDARTNRHPCVILQRSDPMAKNDERVLNGEDLVVPLDRPSHLGRGEDTAPQEASVSFQSVKRADILAGNLVLIRNREMVPADVILLASSAERGSAYIETSSIDGETNLKLRIRANLEAGIVKGQSYKPPVTETLETAAKRMVALTVLGYPEGAPAGDNPLNKIDVEDVAEDGSVKRTSSFYRWYSSMRNLGTSSHSDRPSTRSSTRRSGSSERGYVTVMTSELPNASVNTFSGQLTLPPLAMATRSPSIPLGAENMLLRGAVLRNTEWAIGVVVFTGRDTKLVQNSFKTPSKFSKLDELVNRTVLMILIVMVLVVCLLAGLGVYSNSLHFDEMWYIGYNKDIQERWPYLQNLPPPEWTQKTPNFGQNWFLFFTLLNNFVPLSLYVTMEMITFAFMYFIGTDINMYHEETDTPAAARSTIVTDLGQVEYVFSDKTGTLTQNVMRFKRCSVDGKVFGAPVVKSAPTADRDQTQPYNQLSEMLEGCVVDRKNIFDSEDVDESVEVVHEQPLKRGLTFNAEMFLRVMSICHTVVVEKDYDKSEDLPSDSMKKSQRGGWDKHLKKLEKLAVKVNPLVGVCKNNSQEYKKKHSRAESDNPSEERSERQSEHAFDENDTDEKSADGAPIGFAYQAESPDEGALVSAASLTYGFQLISRDSNGILLKTPSRSIFQNESVLKGIKSGNFTPKALAAETYVSSSKCPCVSEPREEVWNIMAVNKFDSERKRMSILVRSPEELGSLPILFCKGADSAMLDGTVCTGGEVLGQDVEDGGFMHESMLNEMLQSYSIDENDRNEDKEKEYEAATLLGIQAHLGDFASEGLRTLVLGIRILTEEQCDNWLERYESASKSITDRDELLKRAAYEIETDLHVVGATAIEDKLQDGVPDTIASLAKAGIKLWVLTGDKRETAIEIGYSTKVLTPEMHLKEMVDGPEHRIKSSLAMEFLYLVKVGKLTQYQRSCLEQDCKFRAKWLLDWRRGMGRFRRRIWRDLRRYFQIFLRVLCCNSNDDIPNDIQRVDTEEELDDLGENRMLRPNQRRKAVRDYADTIVESFFATKTPTPEKKRSRIDSYDLNDVDVETMCAETADESLPTVFNRARSARIVIDIQRSTHKQHPMSSSMTADIASNTPSKEPTPEPSSTPRKDALDRSFRDDDLMSMMSFRPDEIPGPDTKFDKSKRTALERIFAVDRDVRHGRLQKHLKEGVVPSTEKPEIDEQNKSLKRYFHSQGPRALVIEGAALTHFLGDPLLEEMLFAVANCCDAVIACRVSPKQKALLVKLVRNYVSPTPVTLAIGDGANDVGMIQEAHVGVGISGLEGQQAVNASDFAIAQFRFLNDLITVHGRWNFIRMSKMVLFSFYKNACLAGFLAVFSTRTLYSGTPLFDQWVISMFNFVAGMPILFLGFFDRDLGRGYIRRNPEVFSSVLNNEYITNRTILRWVFLVFIHICVQYTLTGPVLSGGGGETSAFLGLMSNEDRDWPGNGEAGDLKSFGTVIYTCLIITLCYKVLFESRSVIYGEPCQKRNNDKLIDRLPYTWIGIIIFSWFFWLFGAYTYSVVGREAKSEDFVQFTDVAMHVFQTRSLNWMLFLMVPLAACICDVTGKLFANMYFPTQTQIHMEIASKEEGKKDTVVRQQQQEKPVSGMSLNDGTWASPEQV